MAPRPEPLSMPVRPAGGPVPLRQSRAGFRRGVLRALPFLIVMVPFSVLFGVVATEAGLTLAQVTGFSVLVLAGASQFTAVQLMSDGAPIVIVILSCLAVNLRMAMYSASLAPWMRGATGWQRAWVAYALVDQSYALSIGEFERDPRPGLPQRLAFFAGAAATVCLPWMAGSALGATAGRAIPEGIALDFAMPITFLAMIAPMLRTPAHLAACLVGVTGSLLLAGLPSGLGLLIGGTLGMAAGALVERWPGARART